MGISQDDLALLKRVPLLCELSPETLARVTASAPVQRHPRGSVLFNQGESPRHLHILLEGQVGLIGVSADGAETVVEILKAGEIFIAAAVLTDKPWLMTAKVLQPARLLLLPAEQLRADLRQNPELAIAMLTSLSQHYRMIVREVKNLKLKSAAQRLAAYLLSLTVKQDGATVLRLPYNKTLIAARVGIRPESLSRAFNTLQAIGVSVRAQDITIADIVRLAEYCRDDDDAM